MIVVASESIAPRVRASVLPVCMCDSCAHVYTSSPFRLPYVPSRISCLWLSYIPSCPNFKVSYHHQIDHTQRTDVIPLQLQQHDSMYIVLI